MPIPPLVKEVAKLEITLRAWLIPANRPPSLAFMSTNMLASWRAINNYSIGLQVPDFGKWAIAYSDAMHTGSSVTPGLLFDYFD